MAKKKRKKKKMKNQLPFQIGVIAIILVFVSYFIPILDMVFDDKSNKVTLLDAVLDSGETDWVVKGMLPAIAFGLLVVSLIITRKQGVIMPVLPLVAAGLLIVTSYLFNRETGHYIVMEIKIDYGYYFLLSSAIFSGIYGLFGLPQR